MEAIQKGDANFVELVALSVCKLIEPDVQQMVASHIKQFYNRFLNEDDSSNRQNTAGVIEIRAIQSQSLSSTSREAVSKALENILSFDGYTSEYYSSRRYTKPKAEDITELKREIQTIIADVGKDLDSKLKSNEKDMGDHLVQITKDMRENHLQLESLQRSQDQLEYKIFKQMQHDDAASRESLLGLENQIQSLLTELRNHKLDYENEQKLQQDNMLKLQSTLEEMKNNLKIFQQQISTIQIQNQMKDTEINLEKGVNNKVMEQQLSQLSEEVHLLSMKIQMETNKSQKLYETCHHELIHFETEFQNTVNIKLENLNDNLNETQHTLQQHEISFDNRYTQLQTYLMTLQTSNNDTRYQLVELNNQLPEIIADNVSALRSRLLVAVTDIESLQRTHESFEDRFVGIFKQCFDPISDSLYTTQIEVQSLQKADLEIRTELVNTIQQQYVQPLLQDVTVLQNEFRAFELVQIRLQNQLSEELLPNLKDVSLELAGTVGDVKKLRDGQTNLELQMRETVQANLQPLAQSLRELQLQLQSVENRLENRLSKEVTALQTAQTDGESRLSKRVSSEVSVLEASLQTIRSAHIELRDRQTELRNGQKDLETRLIDQFLESLGVVADELTTTKQDLTGLEIRLSDLVSNRILLITGSITTIKEEIENVYHHLEQYEMKIGSSLVTMFTNNITQFSDLNETVICPLFEVIENVVWSQKECLEKQTSSFVTIEEMLTEDRYSSDATCRMIQNDVQECKTVLDDRVRACVQYEEKLNEYLEECLLKLRDGVSGDVAGVTGKLKSDVQMIIEDLQTIHKDHENTIITLKAEQTQFQMHSVDSLNAVMSPIQETLQMITEDLDGVRSVQFEMGSELHQYVDQRFQTVTDSLLSVTSSVTSVYSDMECLRGEHNDLEGRLSDLVSNRILLITGSISSIKEEVAELAENIGHFEMKTTASIVSLMTDQNNNSLTANKRLQEILSMETAQLRLDLTQYREDSLQVEVRMNASVTAQLGPIREAMRSTRVEIEGIHTVCNSLEIRTSQLIKDTVQPLVEEMSIVRTDLESVRNGQKETEARLSGVIHDHLIPVQDSLNQAHTDIRILEQHQQILNQSLITETTERTSQLEEVRSYTDTIISNVKIEFRASIFEIETRVVSEMKDINETVIFPLHSMVELLIEANKDLHMKQYTSFTTLEDAIDENARLLNMSISSLQLVVTEFQTQYENIIIEFNRFEQEVNRHVESSFESVNGYMKELVHDEVTVVKDTLLSETINGTMMEGIVTKIRQTLFEDKILGKQFQDVSGVNMNEVSIEMSKYGNDLEKLEVSLKDIDREVKLVVKNTLDPLSEVTARHDRELGDIMKDQEALSSSLGQLQRNLIDPLSEATSRQDKELNEMLMRQETLEKTLTEVIHRSLEPLCEVSSRQSKDIEEVKQLQSSLQAQLIEVLDPLSEATSRQDLELEELKEKLALYKENLTQNV